MNFERINNSPKSIVTDFIWVTSLRAQTWKVCQELSEAISIMAIRNQTHLLTVPMQKSSHFNNTANSYFLGFKELKCIF